MEDKAQTNQVQTASMNRTKAPQKVEVVVANSSSGSEVNILGDLDILVVIGGFNSSNTTHLQEIAITKNISSFHIDTPERISAEENSILHKPLGSELEIKNNFLPSGKINVGITSGASTPDKVLSLIHI